MLCIPAGIFVSDEDLYCTLRFL